MYYATLKIPPENMAELTKLSCVHTQSKLTVKRENQTNPALDKTKEV